MLDVETRVAAVLRFLASLRFQNVAGDVAELSQPSQSCAIADVTDDLCRMAPNFINFQMDPGMDRAANTKLCRNNYLASLT